MGSVQLILNIDRVDLIIACSVVIIAVLALIAFIAWLVKTGRQNKTLRAIDSKLTPQKPDLIVREIIREGSKSEEKSQKPSVVEKEIEDKESVEEEQETDVLEEIRKMMMSDNIYDNEIVEEKNYNIGKSGKTYTREELEKLIND